MGPGCLLLYVTLSCSILTSFASVVSELNLKCVSLDVLDDIDEFVDLGGLDGYNGGFDGIDVLLKITSFREVGHMQCICCPTSFKYF